MLMTAIKEHGYAGRRVKVGQEYEVRQKDVVILQTAGLARPKKVEKIFIPRVKKIIETREEIPGVIEEVVEFEQAEVSPSESRKRRRRYKRKDMVPEQ